MTILHVVGLGTLPEDPDSEPTQGVARVALEIARAQVRVGHQVWVVGPAEHEWDRYWRGVRLVGVRIASWAQVRWARRHYDLRMWVPLAIFTRRRRFDVVHAHGFERFRLLAGRVRVAHYHNDPLWSCEEESLAAQAPEFRRAARDTRAQIAVSRYVAERLRVGFGHADAAGRLRTDIRIVPNGVDPSQYEPEALDGARDRVRASWGVAPEDVVFLFSGAVVPEKGVDHLALAFGALRSRMQGVRLVLAGGARLWGGAVDNGHAETDEYERRVRELLADGTERKTVRLLGVLPGSAMPAAYAAADIVVAPSVAQEAFGLSILEGMAAGKPVIATAVGGVPELVNGSNGVLVAPGDAEQLHGAMRRLARDSQLRRRLQAGAADTAHRYTWDAAAGQLESLYAELRMPRHDPAQRDA